jgi:hypothetical protein
MCLSFVKSMSLFPAQHLFANPLSKKVSIAGCSQFRGVQDKLNLYVITNHTYIKKLVENKTYTTYIIMDDPTG